MNTSTFQFLLISCLGIFSHFYIQPEAEAMQVTTAKQGKCACIPYQDSLALVGLYEATNGAKWKQTWDLKQPIQTWFGVHLNKSGCVKCLDLDGEPGCDPVKNGGNLLSGTLPDLHLPHLEHLFLASNQLKGTIPDFSKMPNLLLLQLSCNRFSGEIPDFSGLNNLLSLELDNNKLSGALPSLKHLPKLRSLYLSTNRLTGTFPDWSHLMDIERVYANDNQLEGTIPTFPNSSKFNRLLLQNNRLKDSLAAIATMKQLVVLNISNNELSGTISGLEALPKLKSLNLSANNFTGTFPDLGKNIVLQELVLSNNQLAGKVDGLQSNPQLTTLLLDNNYFEGIETTVNLPKLAYLSVNGNALTFSDLLPLKRYLPKKEAYQYQQIPQMDTLITLGKTETIKLIGFVDEEIKDSWFSWYKDGVFLQKIKGDNTLVVSDFGLLQQGEYVCKASHPSFPGLTINSRSYFLVPNQELKAMAHTPEYATPMAKNDFFNFKEGQTKYVFNLIANDQLNEAPYWTIELKGKPKQGFIEDLGMGTYQFISPAGYTGRFSLDYELCNAMYPDFCTSATLTIHLDGELAASGELLVSNLVSEGHPFTIIGWSNDTKKISKQQVQIYNMNGQPVYASMNYTGNWDGRDQNSGQRLPFGPYIYVIQTEEGQNFQGKLIVAEQ